MIFKIFTCPKCQNASTAGNWNIETYHHCKTESQKKLYRKIQHANGTDRWYVCPRCRKPSDMRKIRGKLKFETKDV